MGTGECNRLLFRYGGFDNNVIPEIGSPAPNGESAILSRILRARTPFFGAGAARVGKGELSFDGSTWFSYQEGQWTRTVRAKGTIMLGAINTAGTGQIQITGVPFLSRNNSVNVSALAIADIAAVSLTASTVPVGYLAPNAQATGLAMRGASGDSNLQSSNLTATTRIRFEIEYEI